MVNAVVCGVRISGFAVRARERLFMRDGLIPIGLHNVTLNGVFFRLAALFVVAIARYGASLVRRSADLTDSVLARDRGASFVFAQPA
jgi:hypothetical protein